MHRLMITFRKRLFTRKESIAIFYLAEGSDIMAKLNVGWIGIKSISESDIDQAFRHTIRQAEKEHGIVVIKAVCMIPRTGTTLLMERKESMHPTTNHILICAN